MVLSREQWPLAPVPIDLSMAHAGGPIVKPAWQSGSEDEGYRLIGEFIVAFSQLTCLVELALVEMLSSGNGEQQRGRAQSLVHGNTANTLLKWFFAALGQGPGMHPMRSIRAELSE